MMKQIVLLIIALLLCSGSLQSDDLTGPDIIQKVSSVVNHKTCKTMVKLTTVSPAGKERMCAFWSYSTDSGAKTAIVHLAPAELKGRAYLMHNHGENIWSYSPLHGKVRKMVDGARTQQFEGSHFTFEDLCCGKRIVTDFDAVRLADEDMLGYDCYKLDLVPKKDISTAYARIVMWVTKKYSIPLIIDYYDKDNPEVCSKRVTKSAITMMQTTPTALTSIMHNNLDGTQSTLRLTGCYYDKPIDSTRLTVEGFYK